MMMVRKSKGLSERHKKILAVIEKYQMGGYPPTIREICDETKIPSTSVVNYYLEQLEEWGMIVRDRKISRGVRLAGLHALGEMLRVPVLGRIVAGEQVPIPASDFNFFDSESSVEIARSLLPSRDTSQLYALEVRGNSMIDAMVHDGDIVVMRPSDKAEDGDMVAIWLPDQDETTLKYFYKEEDRFRLQPANPTMKPIYVEKDKRLEIRGKVVMVIRKVDSLAA